MAGRLGCPVSELFVDYELQAHYSNLEERSTLPTSTGLRAGSVPLALPGAGARAAGARSWS